VALHVQVYSNMDKEQHISKSLIMMDNKEFATWYKAEKKRKPEEIMKGTRKMFLDAIWNAWSLGYEFGRGIKNEKIK